MDEQKRIFSINLTNLIERKGITQKQLAEDLNFKPTTVNTWCKGGAFPTSGKLQKIADYFHVGKGDLINGVIDFTQTDERLIRLMAYLKRLNSDGVDKVCERAEELTEMPKYKKENSHPDRKDKI